MLRTRSKANNFIGGLHNSAPIAGVIVFPLRLSCRDESLMCSFLRIMDGTGQLQPGSASGDGSEGGMNWDTDCAGTDGKQRRQTCWEPVFLCTLFDCSVCVRVCGASVLVFTFIFNAVLYL